MRVLALLMAAVFWLIITMAIKAVVDFRYRRVEEHDHVEIKLTALGGLWKFKLTIPTVQLEWEKGPQLELKQKAGSATGGRRESKSKLRMRYFRRGLFYRLWPRIPALSSRLQQVKVRFYRGIHCTALEWRFEIGYPDPAHTALAAGALWAFSGLSVATLYRQVSVEVTRPVLEVVPQFQKQGFACDIHCIFHMRIGHIIFAGLNLIRTFKRGIRG